MELLEEVRSEFALLGLEIQRMNLTVSLRDYARARAQKRELVGKLRAMGDALDRAVEAQIFLTQLGEHVRTLTPDQVRKLLPHMAECVEVAEALDSSSMRTPRAAAEDDNEPMEDGGFVD